MASRRVKYVVSSKPTVPGGVVGAAGPGRPFLRWPRDVLALDIRREVPYLVWRSAMLESRHVRTSPVDHLTHTTSEAFCIGGNVLLALRLGDLEGLWGFPSIVACHTHHRPPTITPAGCMGRRRTDISLYEMHLERQHVVQVSCESGAARIAWFQGLGVEEARRQYR